MRVATGSGGCSGGGARVGRVGRVGRVEVTAEREDGGFGRVPVAVAGVDVDLRRLHRGAQHVGVEGACRVLRLEGDVAGDQVAGGAGRRGEALLEVRAGGGQDRTGG